MHIAVNGWFWDQPNTGSGQYVRRLLHALSKIAPDVQMTLVLPPHNNAPDDVPMNVNLVTTTGRGGRLGKVLFEQRTFPRMVAQIQADIAHVPYWGAPLSSPAPLVTSVLDVIPLVLPDYAPGFFNRLYVSLVSASARGSSHILTLSELSKTDIQTYLHIPADNITVTYLAADEVYHPRMGAERDEAVRQKYNLPDRFVLYLGGFDRRKQVDVLLYAYTYVAQVEEVPLVLAGKEPDWSKKLFPDMRKYAAELNLTEDIIWTGFVDEEDKPSMYRLADVFVYPTLYEGFGLPLVEAMASGTPVAGIDTAIVSEIAGDGAYLVKNARSLAGAILALLGQEPLRDAMVNQGLARATTFNWRKTAKQTLEIYERVLADTR